MQRWQIFCFVRPEELYMFDNQGNFVSYLSCWRHSIKCITLQGGAHLLLTSLNVQPVKTLNANIWDALLSKCFLYTELNYWTLLSSFLLFFFLLMFYPERPCMKRSFSLFFAEKEKGDTPPLSCSVHWVVGLINALALYGLGKMFSGVTALICVDCQPSPLRPRKSNDTSETFKRSDSSSREWQNADYTFALLYFPHCRFVGISYDKKIK